MSAEIGLDKLTDSLVSTITGHRAKLSMLVPQLSGRQLKRVVLSLAQYPAQDLNLHKEGAERETVMILNSIAGAREEYLSILRMMRELTALAAQQATGEAARAADAAVAQQEQHNNVNPE